MKNRSLATILIITILSSSAVIFLAAFAYNYAASRQAVLDEVANEARDLTRATAYKIAMVLTGVEKVPLNLAAVMNDLPLKRPELLRLIKSVVATNPDVYGVAVAYEKYGFDPKKEYFCPYYYRKDGVITYDPTSEGSETYLYWFWDWYQIPQELGRPLWSEPYYDEGSGNIIMSTYSVPFYRNTRGRRTFQGIVAADVSLMWLKDIVLGVKVYQTGYAFLISPNGVFVTYPDPRLIMRRSIFSLAEERHDPRLRQIGRDMIRGGEGLVPIADFRSGRPAWMYYAPVPEIGWSLGVIYPEAELYAPVRALHQKVLLIGILGLVFMGVVVIVVSRSITAPLRTLARKTAAIAQGDFSASVPETGTREIAHLASSFNEMGRQLTDYIEKRDFIRDTFGRYVTQEVVKRLLESKEALELGGELREVSIMMSDLRAFTALTAEMEPEQVITFLNRYLGKMIEILVDYRAVIDEIVGDGILAFFGAPEPMEDHPARAVACALHMQTAMEEINALNQADGLPHLEMGIAVNTGAVVVGNIGSEKRTKYSVVGAHVNVTSRIESYALGGEVLISEPTYERVRDLIEIRDQVRVQMKGVPGTATIYDVKSIRGPYNITLKEKAQTLIPLAAKIPVHVYRISEKIVTGATGKAFITQLSETSALLDYEGEMEEWEDVRIHFLDAQMAEMPGRIYGKVTVVRRTGDHLQEAAIRFTSVSPELARIILQTVART